MNDPYEHFGYHNTHIHSLPREEVEAVQLAAMNLRLDERRGQIKMLEKLADGAGHRADRVARRHGTAVDAARCLQILSGLVARQAQVRQAEYLAFAGSRVTIRAPSMSPAAIRSTAGSPSFAMQTPLDVATSSGSTGTCSFFPKSKRDYRLSMMGLRVQLSQKFGEDPKPGDMEDKIHAIIPLYRDGHGSTGAFAKYSGEIFAKGDPNYWHTAFNFKISSDLMWLAARLRAAAAKGDASKVDVPPSLLARREEWARVAERHAGAAARVRQPDDQGAAGTARLRHEHVQSSLRRGQARPGGRALRRLCPGLGVHGRRRRQGCPASRRPRGSDLQVLQHPADDLLLRHDRDEQLLRAVRSRSLPRAALGDGLPARSRHAAGRCRARASRPVAPPSST